MTFSPQSGTGRFLSLACLVLTLALHGLPGAETGIGINFQGGGPNGTPAAMDASENAGLVAQTNWNTLAGANGSAATVLDGSGAVTDVSITWSANSTWSNTISDLPGDNRLMKGYLDTSENSTSTVTVSGLPAAFTANNSYDVIVYFDGDTSETRRAQFTIGQTTLEGLDAANSNFSGTYVESNGTTAGNYVRFHGLNSSGFTLSATPDPLDDAAYLRAPVNAIQIVPNAHVALALSQVSPASGAAAGGETVTLSGAGFLQGASVTFGGQAATAVTVYDSATLTAVTPAHALGSVAVAITNANGESVTLAKGFIYSAPQAISFNFIGGAYQNGTPPAMTPAVSAGVVPKNYWNSLAGNTGTSNTCVDDTGAAAGAAIAWDSYSTWSTGITESAGNARMMKGYLDTSGNSTTSVTVSNLPAFLTLNNSYDVIVYFDGDNGEDRRALYTIGATTLSGTDPANTDFSGTFVQAANGSNGNYVRFNGLIGNSFTLYATPDQSDSAAYKRAPVNAIQVLAHAHQAIALSAVSPANAGVGGGTVVTLTGSGFLSGASVTVGGASATAVTVQSGTSLTAILPAHAAGTVDVTVNNLNGESATLAGGITYALPTALGLNFIGGGPNGTPAAMAPNEFAGVLPKNNWNSLSGPSGSAAALLDDTGTATGAQTVWNSNSTWSLNIAEAPGNFRMMKGYLDTGMSTTTTVTLSNLPAYLTQNGFDVYVYVDGDNFETRRGLYSINAITQAATDTINTDYSGTFVKAVNGGAGNYVVFSGLSGSSFTLSATPDQSDSALFKRAPVNAIQLVANAHQTVTVSSVAPNTGGTGGGMSVNVTGTGFLSGASVTFGGVAASAVTVQNSSLLSATVPAHALGNVDVSVTNSNGESATLSGGFSYVPPSVLSINFVGGGPDGLPLGMAASEQAGVVPKSNWNNAAGASGSVAGLTDDTGAASAAAVAWSANSTWSTGIQDAPGNPRTMKGYLDSGSNTTTQIVLSNLPAYLNNGFDLYVYFDGDNFEDRRALYTVGATTLSGTDPAFTDYFGVFTQAANGSNGNYVVFRGLSGSGFTLSATPDQTDSAAYKRAPVNAIQIVAAAPANTPPTIASAASATPNPVTGISTNLSVLGASSGGEASLTYFWQTTGTPPAPVNFSINGNNASKNTTATFAAAGTYGFLVTATDSHGLSATSSVAVSVVQTLTHIAVSPSSATLSLNGQQAFTASGLDQFGHAMPLPSQSGPPIITTVAGNGQPGNSGDGGFATAASITTFVGGIAFGPGGDLYICSGFSVIRKVDAATGIISSLPIGGNWVAVDSSNNVYFTTYTELNKYNPATGAVTVLAGTGTFGYSGDGGTATTAQVNNPQGIALDASGNIIFADMYNHIVRKIDAVTGIISTIAGVPGVSGYNGDGLSATSAYLNQPSGIAIDLAGNIFVSDTQNSRVRKIDTNGIISTYAGNGTFYGYIPPYTQPVNIGDNGPATSATLAINYGVALALNSSGDLFIADFYNFRVRMVDVQTGIITTVAGNGTYGFTGDGGPATQAELGGPIGIAMDALGSIYFSDDDNRIRKVALAQQNLAWSATGGSVDQSGHYTAGGTAGSFAVTAKSGTVSGSAAVSVGVSPPSVAVGASAAPNPVSGTSTSLSVLGSDASGESNLIYTWSASGPGSVSFSINGTNASKNSTATFSHAGNYSLTATIKNAGNGSVASSTAVTVLRTLSTPIVVSPSAATLALNSPSPAQAAQQFGASAADQFGDPYLAAAFTWSTNGGGTINATGLFTASTPGGPFMPAAAIGTATGNATVTIIEAAANGQSPDTVAGVSSLLSVLGANTADNTLIYTWSEPSGTVTYSANGSHSASSTTAMFTQPGTFIFTVAASGANISVASSVTVTVVPAFTSATVSPVGAAIPATTMQQFTASGLDQFHQPFSPLPKHTWALVNTVNGTGGSVDVNGLLTAQAGSGGPYTLNVSVNGTVVGSAGFTVVNPLGPVFSNLLPANTTWINTPRPVLSGTITASSLNTRSLIVQLQRNLPGTGTWVDYSGILPVATPNGTGATFAAPVHYDLDEGIYRATATVSTLDGFSGSATWAFNVDLTAPVIQPITLTPFSVDAAGNVSTQNTRPTLHADFTDVPGSAGILPAISGIYLPSVTIILDNGATDTTGTAVTTSTLNFTPIAPVPALSFGLHTAVVQVSDIAGNTTQRTLNFTVVDPTVDITPPVFGAATPALGGYVTNSNPLQPAVLTLAYSDPGAFASGVNTTRVTLQVDTQTVTPTTLGASGLQYSLQGTQDGPHIWSVTVYDHAGNSAVFSSNFIINSIPPTIVNLLPQGGLVAGTPLSSISGQVDDTGGSGVDWSSLIVRVNGNPVAATVTGTTFSATLNPAQYAGTVEVQVNDFAGNLADVFVTRTQALSHFAYKPGNSSTWIEPPTPATSTGSGPVFAIPYTVSSYDFRVAYDGGTDPNTFAIGNPAVLSGATVTYDTVAAPVPASGYKIFHISLAHANEDQEPVAFNIHTAAGAAVQQTFTVNGSIGFFAAAPSVFVSSPSSFGANGAFTPVAFSVYSPNPITSVVATLGPQGQANPGILPLDTSSLPATFFSGNYTPAQPFVSGIYTLTITATDILGHANNPPFTLDFTVASTGPAFGGATPSGYVNQLTMNRGPLSIQSYISAQQNGYAVDGSQVSVAYSLTTAQGTTQHTGAMVANGNEYSYVFAVPPPDGAVVAYDIQAADIFGTITHAQNSFIVDISPPTVTAFTPAASVTTATTQFNFTVQDPLPAGWQAAQLPARDPSGLSFFSATLYQKSSVDYYGDGNFQIVGENIASTYGYNPGTPTLTLNQGVNILANTGYLLLVNAYDNAGNSSKVEMNYYIGATPPAPVVQLTLQNYTGGTSAIDTTATVTVSDLGLGVDPASVIATIGNIPIQPISVSNDSAGTLTLDYAIPPATPNGTYAFNVTATNRAGIPAPPVPAQQFTLLRPAISVLPALSDFTASISYSGDNDFGILPANVVARLDGQAPLPHLNPTFGTGGAGGKGGGSFGVHFPMGTPDGSHTLSVTATDSGGITNTRSVVFILAEPLPPTPVASAVAIGTDFITITGVIPAMPADITGMTVTVPGNFPYTSSFDLATNTWQIVIQNNQGESSGATANYSVVFTNADGLASAAVLSGSPAFTTVPPPPPLNAPLPATVAPPVGAVAQDMDSAPIVYWDFDPADITGVSTGFRGWIPGTKNGTCHINLTVLGGAPPYTVQVMGDASYGPAPYVPGAPISLTLSEGRDQIEVLVSDANGQTNTVATRTIFADTIKPLVTGSARDFGSYAFTNNTMQMLLKEGTFQTDFFDNNFNTADFNNGNDPSVGNTIIDEPSPQSGIAKINAAWQAAGSNTKPIVLVPRDLDGDTYGGLPFAAGIVGSGPFPWNARLAPPRPGNQEGEPQYGDAYPWAGPPNPLPSFTMGMTFADGAGNTRVITSALSLGDFSPPYIYNGGIVLLDTPYFGLNTLGMQDIGPTITPASYSDANGDSHIADDLNRYFLYSVYMPGNANPVVVLDLNPADALNTLSGHGADVVYTGNNIPVLRAAETGNFNVTVTTVWPSGFTRIAHGSVKVVKPELLIDENNDGKTTDEDQQRQLKYGVNVPLNDGFDLGGPMPDYANTGQDNNLRLVTMNSDFDGWIYTSTNVRLWKDKGKTQAIKSILAEAVTENEIGRTAQTPPGTYFQYNARDIANLGGKFYVECIPDTQTPPRYGGDTVCGAIGAIGGSHCDNAVDSGGVLLPSTRPPSAPSGEAPGFPHSEQRFLELRYQNPCGYCSYEPYLLHVKLHAVKDKNEGMKAGAPVVALGGPASVDLTSGALKCVFPVARSGSAIIPDINLYYNSRDVLGGEINPLLQPVHEMQASYNPVQDALLCDTGAHFWHTLGMRLIRGANSMMLIDGDGTRVQFTPSVALPVNGWNVDPNDETGTIWNPETHKPEFSDILTVKETHYGYDRMYYVLRRKGENKQYKFEFETGKLIEIRDIYDNFAKLEYEEWGGTRGRLKAVVDNRGIFVNFSSDQSGNMTVTDCYGRSTSISQTGVNGPLGNFVFAKNKCGRIITFQNLRGAQYVVNPDGGGNSEDADENTDIAQIAPLDTTLPAPVITKNYGIVHGILRVDDSRTMTFVHNFSAQNSEVTYYQTGGDPARITTYTYDKMQDLWLTQTVPGSTVVLTQTDNTRG